MGAASPSNMIFASGCSTLESCPGRKAADTEAIVGRNRRLMLLSDQVAKWQFLEEFARDDVDVLIVQCRGWTLQELRLQVQGLAGSGPAQQYLSIAVLDHGGYGRLSLLDCLGDKEGPHQGMIALADIQTDPALLDFFKWLAGFLTRPDGHIDLMACSVPSTEEGKTLIKSLGDLLGVRVVASSDQTGKSVYVEDGFDYVLGTDANHGQMTQHYFKVEMDGSWKATEIECFSCGAKHFTRDCTTGNIRGLWKGGVKICPICTGEHLARECKQGRGKAFRGAGVCYDFRETGACRFGTRCRFSHDVVPMARTVVVDQVIIP